MAERITTTQQRIVEMMDILKINQADISKRTKIPKSTISNYLSGKRTPNQDQLSLLADPYGINPAWLMGYEVPMFLHDVPLAFDTSAEFNKAWHNNGCSRHPLELSAEEYSLVSAYRVVDDIDKRAVKRILGIEEALKKEDLHA